MPKKTLRWRLALDLGSTSLGWAMLRLAKDGQPCGIVRAGVRIFSDGRNPKDGSSLAVTRRAARAMRRRRDRLLRRKARMLQQLIDYGFFPQDAAERKQLELKNPYELRAKGLDAALSPGEFARALFHLNQRRGFQSNRRTDKGADDKEAGALKTAIKKLREDMAQEGARTVGEWLWRRVQRKESVRARYREERRVSEEGGKARLHKSYDLYIDRAMIAAEFDALWAKQVELNPAMFERAHEDAKRRAREAREFPLKKLGGERPVEELGCSEFIAQAKRVLRDILLHQRPLRPVDPGRCTLLPDEKRAPVALPSAQRFRILQEVNHLRVRDDGSLLFEPLDRTRRDKLIELLEKQGSITFASLKKKLGLGGAAKFNFERGKKEKLEGNATNAVLASKECFDEHWYDFSLDEQDDITMRLLVEENEDVLCRWLREKTGVDEERARTICAKSTNLKSGYGRLSRAALQRIVPKLRELVPDAAGALRPRTYDEAVRAAGFESHSAVDTHATGDVQEMVDSETGEITRLLPYYGRVLHRHVAFGTGNPQDSEEKRYGKIANPTVHIGLNQVRKVVNALVQCYGHPTEIIVEVARDLKQGRKERERVQEQQKENQKRNERIRRKLAEHYEIPEHNVKHDDVRKYILWEELNPDDPNDRRCPYSGVQIGMAMLFPKDGTAPQAEIEHILPYSRTLDDSLMNLTVSLRDANRIKGNRTPWEARNLFEERGWAYASIMQRAALMAKGKGYRFAEGGLQRWLREDKDFIARALNDTRYLSKLVAIYLRPICRGGEKGVRAIPGRMTALLRGKFGLNGVLSLEGEKNRNDHRHHAVDACVIGVTDQGLLQRFARASASAREKALDRLVETMPLPWDGCYQSVQRAVDAIWVSHKPDHSHEGQMLEETSYGLHGAKAITSKIGADGVRERTEKERDAVVPIANQKAPHATNRPWHGSAHYQQGTEYKGYQGGSNWCMEIVRDEKGRWKGEIVSTFQAYKLARTLAAQFRAKHGSSAQVPPLAEMMSATHAASGKPLVMRLMKGDMVRLALENGTEAVMRLYGIKTNGQLILAPHEQANVSARNLDKSDDFNYTTKTASALQKAKGRRVSISPIGKLNDPGFKE